MVFGSVENQESRAEHPVAVEIPFADEVRCDHRGNEAGHGLSFARFIEIDEAIPVCERDESNLIERHQRGLIITWVADNYHAIVRPPLL